MSDDWTKRARIHAVLADPHRLEVLHHVAVGDRTPKELAELLDLPMPLMSHHLKVLAESGLIVRSPSERDRRRYFVAIHPSAVEYLDRQWLRAHLSAPSGRVVFACTHNSARSVLAAALWSQRTQRPVAAGGTTPGSRIHPNAVRIARRHHLPLLQSTPVRLDEVLDESDLLVTVCDAANEQVRSHAYRLHWSIPDPASAKLPRAFQDTFDRLAVRVGHLRLAFDDTNTEEIST